jgi:serine/threonine-protein kinase
MYNTGSSTANGSTSAELDKVKQALAVKVQKHGAHYSDVALLGKGSFGEVHEARDALLGREVAIKSLKKEFRDQDPIINRFLKEARGTAQLEHPNIMPVHEMGFSDEFGIYFTMKKIDGENLKEILDKLKANTSFYSKTYSVNFLLEAFLSICNGVAFAHSKGVVHRDLKPANIMVGRYGEVLILDWGLVKQIGADEPSGSGVHLEMDDEDTGVLTVDGSISGTPNYMAPEQAEGRIGDIDFQSDVYSLGAILYQILTYHPPFEKTQIRKLLDNVKTGRFTPPRKRFPERKIPRELEAICLKAMSLYPINRYRTVEHFAQDIRNYIGHFDVRAYKASRLERWWKACRRNPVRTGVAAAGLVALMLAFSIQRAMLYGSYRGNVKQAEALKALGHSLTDRAMNAFDDLERIHAASELKETTPQEAEFKKLFEEHSTTAGAKFNVAEMFYESVPAPYRSSAVVREGIVDIMQRRIDFALHCRHYERARQWLETIQLRISEQGIAADDETLDKLEAIQHLIDGKGRLEITGPDTIHGVVVWPLLDDPDEPMTMQGDAVKRGRVPVTADPIDKGSYVLQVTLGDGGMMPFPVHIDHGENIRYSVKVPPAVPEGMAYIPGGPFIFGGDDSRFYRRQTRTLPSFFIKKHEVTVAEYLEFWSSLKTPELRSEYMSRIRFKPEDRRYEDAWSADGTLADKRLSPDYPVVGITLEAAEAFCEWKSRRSGKPIRLPTAMEWEKAARGVDGRKYVWGNGYDAAANLALSKGNEKGKARYPFWAPPGTFSRDLSIYGVYDMAGNVREMTCSRFPGSNLFYQLKGGSASTPENFLPCSYSSDTPVVPSDVGFRYMQEIPSAPGAEPIVQPLEG